MADNMAPVNAGAVEGFGQLGGGSAVNELDALMEKAKSTGPDVSAASAATNNFAGNQPAKQSARKPKSDEDIKRSAGITTVKKYISANAENLKGTPRDLARDIMCKHSECHGYIVKSDEKVDFATAAVKDTKNVDLVVKMSPPSAVSGFVVTYPQAVKAFIAGESSSVVTPEQNVIVDGFKKNPGTVIVDIIDKANISNFIANFTGNYLTEAKDIFKPFIKKGRGGVTVYDQYEDEELYSRTGGKVGIMRYIQVSGLSEDKVNIRTRHSTRPRYIAPGNYIAEKKFETFCPVGRSFSEEEAKELNDLYFSKFLNQPKKNGASQPPKYNSFSVESRKMLSLEDNDKLVSVFFGPDAANVWSKVAVGHWYNKDAEGKPVQLTGKQIQLVRKEKKIKADNTVSNRPSLISRPLVSDKSAAADAYKWDPNHPVVKSVAAAGAEFTFETYINYVDARKSQARPTGKSAQIGNIGGLDDETIRNILRKAAGVVA